MQTVHFTCPHCKNLMAVGSNLLGRNVRCPHCKQVVQAPATANAGPVQPVEHTPAVPQPALPQQLAAQQNLPQFQMPAPPQEGHESIFGEAHDDDVFGRRDPPKPVLPPLDHGPAQPAVPPFAPPPAPYPEFGEPTPANASPPRRDDFSWGNEPTVPESQPNPSNPWASEPTAPMAPAIDAAPAPQPSWPQQQPTFQPPPHQPATANPWSGQPAVPTYAPEPAEQAPEPERRENPLRPHRATPPPRGGGGGMLTWVLLLWAVAATGAAAYFLLTGNGGGTAEHPFTAIPDFFGQFDKADRKKTSFNGMPPADLALPAALRVPVGGKLTVGQLEVEPIAIERKRAAVYRQPVGGEAVKVRETDPAVYLLRLKVKNLSDDTYFHPNDPAFNRRAKGEPIPYNRLVIGPKSFYGGPFFWPPPAPNIEREFVEGQEKDHIPLGPKEERETSVCTVPGEPIEQAIKGARDGPFVWRVQLRRGLVRVHDDGGKERDVSATAVIGVEFQASDVQHRVELN